MEINFLNQFILTVDESKILSILRVNGVKILKFARL